MCIRLTVLLCLWVHVLTAQNPLHQRVSIQFSNTPASQALDQLGAMISWKFSYNPDQLPKKQVTGTFKDKPVSDVLKAIAGPDFDFKSRGSFIILQHKRAHSSEESISISGRIVDASTGNDIQNASVYDANSLTASLTDQHGQYSFTVEKYDEYALVAISKEHYKDTLIRLSQIPSEPIVLQLTPVTEKEQERIDSVKRVRVFRFLKNQQVKEHDKNVTLHEHRPAQLSLVPVIGSNGVLGAQITNSFSINLVAGYANALSGMEIGGAVNMEKASVRGVQIAGVTNWVGADVNGVQIAGFSNTTLEHTSGVAIGGTMNTTGSADGLQLSGAYGYVKNELKGLQLSGAINHAGDLKGWQIAGAANLVKNQVKGVQISGAINRAGELHGVQIGVINFAGKVEKGAMIGFLNFAGEGGFMRLELQNDDLNEVGLAFKSGTRAFYSILGAGISPLADIPRWSYTLGIGSQKALGRKFHLNIEGLSSVVQPLRYHLSGLSTDQRFQLLFGYPLLEHLSLHFGPVFHFYIHANEPSQQEFYDAIGFDPLFSAERSKAGIGYQVGIRF